MHVWISAFKAIGLQSMVVSQGPVLALRHDEQQSRSAERWRNWHVEDGVIKLPVTAQPQSIYQYEPWQTEKMNWTRLNGCGEKKEKKMASSFTYPEQKIETKGAFYGETIFCV